jgi:hypothetical protein
VMAEIPGITPKVAQFARRVRDIGLTVVLPDMFGIAGRDPNPEGHGSLGSVAYGVRTITQLCVSREFICWPPAAARRSPHGYARSAHMSTNVAADPESAPSECV